MVLIALKSEEAITIAKHAMMTKVVSTMIIENENVNCKAYDNDDNVTDDAGNDDIYDEATKVTMTTMMVTKTWKKVTT